MHLGTNGTFTSTECRQNHRIAGARREFHVPTSRAPHSWVPGNNRVITRRSARFHNISLIDWQKVSAGHSRWFYTDGIHLTPAGARAYARLVSRSVG